MDDGWAYAHPSSIFRTFPLQLRNSKYNISPSLPSFKTLLRYNKDLMLKKSGGFPDE
jgi:hypothetical protein